MRELTRSVARFSWAMSLFGVGQVANLVSPLVNGSFNLLGQDAAAAGGGAAPAASGLLSQAGNLAFSLLQLGVDTVYNVAGTAWQQQQGLPGWGPIPPPGGQP